MLKIEDPWKNPVSGQPGERMKGEHKANSPADDGQVKQVKMEKVFNSHPAIEVQGAPAYFGGQGLLSGEILAFTPFG